MKNFKKLLDKADVTWITNEYEVGDFSMICIYEKRSLCYFYLNFQ